MRHVQAKSNADTTQIEEAPPLEDMGGSGGRYERRYYTSSHFAHVASQR
ncbi:MAG: hypothetical protein ACYSYV_12710 [Planctomycetota bacterium]